MSDAEMITILVLFHSNTFRNFKHFYLFYVCRELKEEFPHLLSYTRFVERMPRVAIPLLLFLKLALMRECTGITFIDSTHIPVCENKREYSNRVFKGYAHKGKSTMGWYYGFKLHLLCNERGELLNFVLTKANVDDRNPEVFNNLTKDLFGKLYADKAYPPQKYLKFYCKPFGRNGGLCFLRYKTLYQYGICDGWGSRSEAAHTFLNLPACNNESSAYNKVERIVVNHKMRNKRGDLKSNWGI